MKIGLIDVDGHGKKKKWGATIYPNLALCKISSYHKSIGDTVEWYDHMYGGLYDIVYIAKVFTFSPDIDFPVNAKQIIKGGTGYDIASTLPDYIEHVTPDFSIYPQVPSDTSYGFLTRGCPNKCFWCVVPKKEGHVRPYQDIETVSNGKKNVVLMDNNFLAAGQYTHQQLDKIISLGIHVDFNQALDARLVDDSLAKKLAKVKFIHSRIRFGCDTHKQIQDCEKAISLINKYGFKGEYFLYTKIGGSNNFQESFERINYWHKRLIEHRETKKGRPIYAYAQPYRDPLKTNHKIPLWQKDLAQWCNKRMIFCTCEFQEFSPRKGFLCKSYFN